MFGITASHVGARCQHESERNYPTYKYPPLREGHGFVAFRRTIVRCRKEKRREEKRRGIQNDQRSGKEHKDSCQTVVQCTTVPGSFQQFLLGFGICFVASRQDALIDCNSQVVIAVFIAVLELPDVLVCFGVAVVVPDDVINMLSWKHRNINRLKQATGTGGFAPSSSRNTP